MPAFGSINSHFRLSRSWHCHGHHDASYLQAALDTCRQKVDLLSELPGFADFYFVDEVTLESEATKILLAPENKARLTKLRDAFSGLASFNADALQACLKSVAAEFALKVGALVHPVRVACTGKTIGPSLYHLLEVLGKDVVLKRLDRAIARFEDSK